jgi:hypothetical protein
MRLGPSAASQRDPAESAEIRAGKANLDWQAFSTRAEAGESAKEWALPGEGYTIEEHGEACSQCKRLFSSATSNPGD